MSEHAAFLQAICENPDDDTPRLVYADWLDDHGDPELADFIRTQIELARIPEYDPIWQRVWCSRPHQITGFRKLPELPSGLHWTSFCYRRGFPWRLGVLDLDAFLAHAAHIFTLAPVQALEIDARNGADLGPLADSPHLQRLRSLDFHLGRLGEAPIRRLAESPHATGITELSFQFAGIVGNGLHCLLRTGLAQRLQRLLATELGPLIVDAFQDSPSLPALEALNLSQNRLGAEPLRALLDSWDLPALRQLDLGNSPLGPNGVQFLARAPEMTRLNQLDLAQTEPGLPGLRALLDAFPQGSLQSLSLANNRLGPVAARAVAQCYRLAGLRSLDLRNNPLGDNGIIALARSPYLKNLGSLKLYRTGITDEGLKALIDSPYLGNLIHLDLFLHERSFSAPVRQALHERFGQRCWQ